jgi:hypothetical protein
MPDIYDLGRQFQRELLQHERAAASEMVHYYGAIWQSIDRQIRELTKSYYADPERPANWLYRYDRLSTLRAQAVATTLCCRTGAIACRAVDPDGLG